MKRALLILLTMGATLLAVASIATAEHAAPPDGSLDEACQGPQFYPFEWDANRFIHCDGGDEILKQCPPTLVWDRIVASCNHLDETDVGEMDVKVGLTAKASIVGVGGRIIFTATMSSPDFDGGQGRIHSTLPAGLTWKSGTGCFYDAGDRSVDCFIEMRNGRGSGTFVADSTTKPRTITVGAKLAGSSPADRTPANNGASTRCAVATKALIRCGV